MIDNLSTRQKEILALLKNHGGKVSSAELTQHFDVSVQTIRKELNLLSELALVKRVHGGICLPVQRSNLSFSNRQIIHLEEKKQIASQLVAYLPEGCSLFLGIGTTPEQIARHLIHHPGLTVITNNLNAAIALCENPNIETHMVSGRIRGTDQDVVGEDATQYLRKFQVNYGICGVGGISSTGDLLDFSPEESHLSQAILDNCEQRLLVADQHKFQRSAPVKSSHLKDIDMFFTNHICHELMQLCEHHDVKVTTADNTSARAL